MFVFYCSPRHRIPRDYYCEYHILLLSWAGLLIQPNENIKGIPNIHHDRKIHFN